MGDALCKIANLNCGLPDTLAYYSDEEFITGFKKTMAFQPRVVKQNRGSSGEGIWIIKLKDKEYCANYGDALCEDDWMLDLMEANDNHQEFHTVAEFIEWCINGRGGGKCDDWTSKGTGAYLAGGKEAGGQIVDQRFCPRIVEGEIRVLTSGPTCLQLIHKKPADGGISAVLGTGSTDTFYSPDEPKFADLKKKLFVEDLPKIMPALGLDGEPFPIVWTTDLIIAGTDAKGNDVYTVGEFNCSCVGISKFQACAYPDKSILDVTGFDFAEAQMVADTAGVAAIAALDLNAAKKPTYLASQVTSIAGEGPWGNMIGPCDALAKQPASPEFKLILVEYFMPAHASGCGGYDKGKNGHRVDSIPIANGVVKAGSACVPIFYVPAFHDLFSKVAKSVNGIIVRINPGQLSGGDQDKFDNLMRECIALGIPVWSSPDVQIKMGAKDALCKIANLNCGLPDTLAYYSDEEFISGFKKTMAFQPRVVKQNRGSAGEGIWIIKLKDREYCPNYGDAAAEDDWMLELTEANDNHVEHHTVREFINWCVEGRVEGGATWESKGTGKYFEGGKEAGGQMVDQRFLPRIDEGEARFMMIGMDLNRIEHYKYIGGVGGETETTIFGPDEEKYKATKDKLVEEIPKMMEGM